MTERFRRDNTEGYTQDQLDELNRLFDAYMASSDTEHLDDSALASFEDFAAEQVQAQFDYSPHGRR